MQRWIIWGCCLWKCFTSSFLSSIPSSICQWPPVRYALCTKISSICCLTPKLGWLAVCKVWNLIASDPLFWIPAMRRRDISTLHPWPPDAGPVLTRDCMYSGEYGAASSGIQYRRRASSAHLLSFYPTWRFGGCPESPRYYSHRHSADVGPSSPTPLSRAPLGDVSSFLG